ncbi:MAG: hypothetical protein VX027_00100 [Bacteroidota bacterium]|nr:hypothetical protein [Bacteroidota bacterium]
MGDRLETLACRIIIKIARTDNICVWIESLDGVIAIGVREENDELIVMSEQQSIEEVLRTKNTSEIGETTLSLDELTSEHRGMFVTLKSIHYLV